jgi:rhamnosyltransferase
MNALNENVGELITVVIRTFNSEKTLQFVLDKICKQLNPRFIVCVDSGSNDETLEIIKKNGCRIHELRGKFGYSRALNEGFSLATTEWVLSLSSHCIPIQDDFISKYRAVIAQVTSSVSCISGVASMLKKSVAISDEFIVAYGSQTALLGGLYCGNSNTVYRRSVWLNSPFNENIKYGEDLNWALAALQRGEHIAVSFSVPVAYRHAGNFWSCLRKGIAAGVEGVERPERFKSSYVELVVPIGAYARRVAIIAGDKIGRVYARFLFPLL